MNLESFGFDESVISVLERIEREGSGVGADVGVGRCEDAGGGFGYWNVPRSTGVFLYSLVQVLGASRVLEIGTSVGYSGIFLCEAIRGCDKAFESVGVQGGGGMNGVSTENGGEATGAGGGGVFGAPTQSGGDCAYPRPRLFYSIESNEARFERGCENFAGAGVENAVLIRAHAPEIFLDDKYFVDAEDRVRFFGVQKKSVFCENSARGNFGETLESSNLHQAGIPTRPYCVEALRDLRRGQFDFVFFDATKGEYLSYLKAVLPLMSVGGIIVADNCDTHSESVKEFFEFVKISPGLKCMSLNLDNGLLLIKVGHLF